MLFAGLLIPAGCATHCGFLTYCDIPENWPIADTFMVEAGSGDLCISGTRHASCSSRGVFQSGARTVIVHLLKTHEDDDEDDHDLTEVLATLHVSGSPGDRFTASCFQYNGKKILGMTEVLTGIEIRNRAGAAVAVDPAHPVVRRNGLLSGC